MRIWKLQQTAAKSAEIFFNGLSQGIKKVISKCSKTDPDKNNDAKDKESDPESSDSETEDSKDKSEVPDCFQELKKKVKTDNRGPPISKEIAKLLENCWHIPFPKEEILETLDNQVRPKNVDAVKPLEIDPEVPVYAQDKKNEKEFRYIGNAICGAGKCLAYLMDMLATAETYLRKDFPDDNGWLVVDDFEFDFGKANKLIVNAMKLLGIANVQTGQARCEMLKEKFNPEFQKLCNPENPFTNGKFFGDNLSNTTAQLISANKVQNKTFNHGRGKSSRGKGRGRKYGRKSHPYNPNYQPQSQSSALQAAVVQQALASAAAQQHQPSMQPHVHQQVSGLTTGGIFGINQCPQQAQPMPGIPSIVNLRMGGRGRSFNRFRQRGGRGRRYRRSWVSHCLRSPLAADSGFSYMNGPRSPVILLSLTW